MQAHRRLIAALIALFTLTAPAAAYTPKQTTVLDNIAVAIAARQTCARYDVDAGAVLIELMSAGLGPDALRSIEIKVATARAQHDADVIGHAAFCQRVDKTMGPDSDYPLLKPR